MWACGCPYFSTLAPALHHLRRLSHDVCWSPTMTGILWLAAYSTLAGLVLTAMYSGGWGRWSGLGMTQRSFTCVNWP
jgi:hypothetical protein